MENERGLPMTLTEEIQARPREISLFIIGLMSIAMSISVWGQPGLNALDRAVWHEAVPIPIRSGMWFFSGIAILIAGTNPKLQTYGYMLAVLGPFERCVSYIYSFVQYLIPEEPSGDITAIGHAAWWGLLTFYIYNSGRLKGVKDVLVGPSGPVRPVSYSSELDRGLDPDGSVKPQDPEGREYNSDVRGHAEVPDGGN